jgi:hypothetical protein
MKQLVIISSLFIFTGCSSIPENKTPLVVVPTIPKCDIQLTSGTTYWSRIENGSIYLFIGERRVKCLLRKL